MIKQSISTFFRRVFATIAAALGALAVTADTRADLPAFPGAQGFGKYATGGRGGSVYYVTNLNDSGPGSFRDAVSQPNRTVVFAVSGVIDFQPPRYNVSSNITIAGQTAPGDGVVLYGDGIGFSNANNSITRFMRFRMGAGGADNRNAMTVARGNDMIFDHVSTSWGRDETFSLNPDRGYEINRITIQNTIIAQGLLGHSAGSLIQTEGGVSILHSLYHSNNTRNPRARLTMEYVNNVVYNWGVAAYILGSSAGNSHGNVFGNYFINGPSGSGPAFTRGNANYHIFARDNWQDSSRNGVLDGRLLEQADYHSDVTWHDEPYPYPFALEDALPARTALKSVISKVGASIRRDEVDDQLLRELESWGTLGQLISNEFEGPMNGPGWFRPGRAYTDTSRDGMPDFWKQGTGQDIHAQNHNDPSPSGSGYTRLEDYLNWLAKPHGIAFQDTTVFIDLRQFTRGFVPFGPVYSIANVDNGTATLVNGYLVRFEPEDGFEGPTSFDFTVVDEDGDTLTRTMNLFFSPVAHTGERIWQGTPGDHAWNAETPNWFDGRSLHFPFQLGDNVTLDHAGHPVVHLEGVLEPGLVRVVADEEYLLTGNGSLAGEMALQKSGAGLLVIETENTYTGDTTIEEGGLLLRGTMTGSHVTVSSNARASGTGHYGAGLTLHPGATLAPGDETGDPGTLSVSGDLILSEGSTVELALSNDPTGQTEANDLIRIDGDLHLQGPVTIQIDLLHGAPEDGAFTLFAVAGNLHGDLEDIILLGASGELAEADGTLQLQVSTKRPPAELVWSGDGFVNLWDTGVNPNWRNDGEHDVFLFLDPVIFDDTGSTSPPVNLVGNLSPASVTVDAEGEYTFAGTGRITGATGLTKRGPGTLNLRAISDYTGPTVIEGGVVEIMELTNAGQPGPLGAATAEPENLVIENATLRASGNAFESDRGITLGEAATFEISAESEGEVRLTGVIAGGGSLIKQGPGRLILSAENTYLAGTVIEQGELALDTPAGPGTTTANDYALGSGSVTFRGGVLRLYGGGLGDAGPGYGTFDNPLVVPEGETGTLITPGRYRMGSSLSGSGTLNFEANYVRGMLAGDWSEFSGLINVTAAPQSPGSGRAEFRVSNSHGYPNATLYLHDGVNLTRRGGADTIRIGALGGTAGARIEPGNSNSGGTHYIIGSNDRDAAFAGRLQNDGGTVAFTKVGRGSWTLSGANTYTGGTIINEGTIRVENTSGSALGNGPVTVNQNGTLAGTGFINGPVTIAAGGTIDPGGDGDGVLTVNDQVTLQPGSSLRIRIDPEAQTSDRLDVGNTLQLGGSLLLQGPGWVPAAGDTFQLFDAETINGEFAALYLPPLPGPELEWDTSDLATTGHIRIK